MKRVSVAVVVLLISMFGAARAGAQTPDQSRESQTLMQHQLDVLQAYHNARFPSPRMATYLDGAFPVFGGYAVLVGWGMHCGPTSLRTAIGQPPARLDVVIDGLPTRAYFVTGERSDVRAAYDAWCGAEGTPVDPGVFVFVDLTAYAPGSHRLALRLSDDTTGIVIASNTATVTR